jgi:hypothetical protein
MEEDMTTVEIIEATWIAYVATVEAAARYRITSKICRPIPLIITT